MVAADLNGDGADELVVRTAPARLGAVGWRQGKPELLWEVGLPAEAGSSIVADVDGDGKGELVVGCGDGSIVALGK
jgi:hypothetical protein